MKANSSQDGEDSKVDAQSNQSRIAQVPDFLRYEMSEALEDAELVLDLAAICNKSKPIGRFSDRRALVTSQSREAWDSGKITDEDFTKFVRRTRLTVSALYVLSDVEEEAWKPINGSCGEAAEQLDCTLEAVENLMK